MRFASMPVVILILIVLVALALALSPPLVTDDFESDARHCASNDTDPDLAVAACTRLIQSDRDDDDAILAFAYNGRGNAYRHKGEYDRAIQDYDQAIHLRRGYAYAYLNRGNAYGSKGEYDRAIQDYDLAISVDPKHAYAYRNRGAAYSNKGEYDRAIQDYDQAIRLDPEFAGGYNSLAWLLATGPRHLRDGGKAVRLAGEALALFDKPSYRDTLAAAYVEAGDATAAIREYEAVMEMEALSRSLLNFAKQASLGFESRPRS